MEKKKFRLEDYEGDYAMHCPKEEKAKIFCKFLDKNGKRWISGDSYVDDVDWDSYKEETCYAFNESTIGCIDDYKNSPPNEDYTILEFDDFDWSEEKPVDFKVGDKVECYVDEDEKVHEGTVIYRWNPDTYYVGFDDFQLYEASTRRNPRSVKSEYRHYFQEGKHYRTDKTALTLICRAVPTQEPVASEIDYRANILEIMDRQKAKGIKKYGEVLEENTTLTRNQRIEHIEEELIDGLQYLEHLKVSFKDSLTANDYQRAALRTATEHEDFLDRLDNAAYGLNEESGEFAGIIKKHKWQGHDLDEEHMVKELGDILWYVALAADGLGKTLEEVMLVNIEKLKNRYPDGFSKDASLHRKEGDI